MFDAGLISCSFQTCWMPEKKPWTMPDCISTCRWIEYSDNAFYLYPTRILYSQQIRKPFTEKVPQQIVSNKALSFRPMMLADSAATASNTNRRPAKADLPGCPLIGPHLSSPSAPLPETAPKSHSDIAGNH